MKRISYLFLLTILVSMIISSCKNDETYAELLKSEKEVIEAYIKRNNINVLSAFPKDSIWKENDYVLTSSGLYFHLVSQGDLTSKDTLELKDKVVPRFKQYTLDLSSDTTSNWSTIDYPRPAVFVYGDPNPMNKAFQEAASYMKRNDSEAKLIVTSKIGFNEYLKTVTPLGYDFKIKIQK